MQESSKTLYTFSFTYTSYKCLTRDIVDARKNAKLVPMVMKKLWIESKTFPPFMKGLKSGIYRGFGPYKN